MTKDQPKVLFVDEVHPSLEDRLNSLGYACISDFNCSYEELKVSVHTYTGLVIRSRVRIDNTLLETASRLKFIARSGAGLENIDTNYCKKNGIAVFNAPEGNRNAVGEHCIGMLLSLFRNICRSNSEVRNGLWKREENRGTEIKGKTVGIIGYGNMGSAFAKCLRGFDCNVMAYDKYKEDYGDEFVTETDMETIFRETDILSLHIPLSKETEYLVNNQFLKKFSKNIYLINTARGNHVQIAGLLDNLESGKVKGACLDVLEYEKTSFEKLSSQSLPDDFSRLLQMENVILSPHIAGWTHESYIKLSEVLGDKIEGLKSKL